MFHRKFKRKGIHIVLVLDGTRNPLKEATNQAREKERLKLEIKIRGFVSEVDNKDVESLNRLLKAYGYVREDILFGTVEWVRSRKVPYICLPMEADWPLVRWLYQWFTNN